MDSSCAHDTLAPDPLSAKPEGNVFYFTGYHVSKIKLEVGGKQNSAQSGRTEERCTQDSNGHQVKFPGSKLNRNKKKDYFIQKIGNWI